MSRLLYSTDASSYQIMPAGVVLPRDAEDLAAVIGLAARHDVPIIPRGGGTSLSGQTVGPALILDLSRYMDGIPEINPDERWVRVEAGVVLDRLHTALRPYGLMVGPDPASSAAATIGGMTGNNSTGAHSIVHGMMADHVREVTVILADGTLAHLCSKTTETATALALQSTREGMLYRDVALLLDHYRQDIETGYPSVWRNVAGYTLNRMLESSKAGRSFNLAPLIVGSEGTLATVCSVKLGLVPCMPHSRIAVVHFETLYQCLESVPVILETGPASAELIDRFFIRLTRLSPEFGPRLHFIDGDPEAVLVVEYAGESRDELAEKAARLEIVLKRRGFHGRVVHQVSPEEIENVWIARKAGFGLLMSRRGDAKPLSFVDDAVVPLDRMVDFTRGVREISRGAGTEASFYAHASAGCLHVTPLINLKSAKGLEQMRIISSAVTSLAIELDGTTTGEHGEGLARSYYNEQLYGPRLHQAFREVKALFDPKNIMNPGKIVEAPAPWDPALLRYSPDYRAGLAPGRTFLDFSLDGGFAGSVEMCNGMGICRKRDEGVMCPSFMVTRDEAHSTRGRANALRAAMTGRLGPEGMTSRELHDVLDLCLECKACKRECASQVDMAKLKSEFLAHYQARHGIPPRSRIFGHIETLSRLGSLSPALANRLFTNPLVRRLMDRWLGIDRRRILPPLAPRTFQKWFHGRARNLRPVRPVRGAVILWDDIYLSHNEPEVGQAAVKVLEAAGFEVRLVAGRRCDGRPLISKGLLADARRRAEHNIGLLAPLARQSIPIVGVEPSSITTFRDEYPDLLPGEEARLVAGQSFMMEEFLDRLAERGELDLPLAASDPHKPRHVLLHGHCYQKSLSGTGPVLRMLRLLPDTTVEEIPSGCCGMAGAFGYEREHYEVSMACGEDRLFPFIRSAPEDALIAAAGFSCRHQITHGTGRWAVHPVVILADGLR